MVNKWLRVWLVVGAAITLAAVPYLLLWERLPDPMASHWGPGSEVDGSMPRFAGLVTTTVLILLVGGGLSVMLARQSEGRREPSPESLALTLTVLLGGFLPAKRIPVERIANAEADYIEPTKWGGWG